MVLAFIVICGWTENPSILPLLQIDALHATNINCPFLIRVSLALPPSEAENSIGVMHLIFLIEQDCPGDRVCLGMCFQENAVPRTRRNYADWTPWGSHNST